MSWDLPGNSGTNPATDFLGTTDRRPLVIRTNSQEALRVDALGNVGLGGIQPTQRLTLGSGNILLPTANMGIDGNLYLGGITDTGETGLRLFGGVVNGSIHAGFIDVRTTDPTDGLRIRVDTSDGGTERLRITAMGNVGVGTASPTEKLEIAGGNLSLWRTGSNATSQALVFKPHDSGPSDSLRKVWVEQFNMKFQIYGGSNERFQFQDHNGNVHLTINGNGGNVGVGVMPHPVYPREKLYVYSPTLLSGEGIFTAANPSKTGNAVAISGLVGTAGSQVGTGGPVAVLGLVSSDSDAGAKAIHGWTADYTKQYAGHFAGRGWFGGNVGIGIGAQNPAFNLDVAGSAHASSFPTSSDIRLKTNVRQLTDVLDKLEGIRGISFEWNGLYESLGRSTGHREIGVVAQDVEAVFPELVSTWGDDGYKAVDYGRLTGVLVESVKQLKARNEALERRLQVLENGA